MSRIRLLLIGCLFQLSILIEIGEKKFTNLIKFKELINRKKNY